MPGWPARVALISLLLLGAGCARVPAAENNWGRWGPDDEAGTLNYITPEVRRQAATAPRRGKVF